MGINVISLFDGMSCGQIALDKLGVPVDNYIASEIDKDAIKVAKSNYPFTQHMGSVTDLYFDNGTVYNWLDEVNLGDIDLLMGGSPCQNFSFSGTRKGMVTKDGIEILSLDHYLELKEEGFAFHGQSFLFWEYVRLLKAIKPKYFLLENVKMVKKWENLITSILGVEPIEINSALVSAQNRKRLYWTNIEGVTQPEDRGIFLKDIVHEFEGKPLSEQALEGMLSSSGNWNPRKNNRFESYLNYPDRKHKCLMSNIAKGTPHNCFFQETDRYVLLDNGDKSLELLIPEATKKGYIEASVGDCIDLKFLGSTTRRGRLMRDKSNCLTTGDCEFSIVESLARYIVPFDKTLQILDKEVEKGKVGFFRKDSQANRVYYVHGKAVTLCGEAGGGAAKMGQYLFGCISPDRIEKRQIGQRFSDGRKFYTLTTQDKHGVLIEGYIRKLTPVECERLQTVPDNYTNYVSETQRYRMLGNGWTVDAIEHILSFAKL